MNIGIAGTGKMGTAIAGRLIGLGHTVRVWNRTLGNTKSAKDMGAIVVDSPHSLMTSSETIICLLTDEAALDSVYVGKDGLLSSDLNQKLIIEMSTVSPQKQKEISSLVIAKNGRYIECPVGGSVGPAKEGKLLGFVGGKDADVSVARPLLEQICRRVEHVGTYGAGAMMKLGINLPLMVYWQTLAEALSLVAPLGLDPKRVIDIFSDSSAGPNLLKNRGPVIAQTLIDGSASNVNVPIETVRKDIRSMLEYAKSLNVSLPVTETALIHFDKSSGMGLDKKDSAEHIVRWLSPKT